MIVSTHPLADAELADGAAYYAGEGDIELAERFIAEFEKSIRLLRDHPSVGSVWRGKFRRLPIRRFPYSIVYCRRGEALHIIAVAHQSRRPGYWRRRA